MRMNVKTDGLMVLPPRSPELWDDQRLSQYRNEVGIRSEMTMVAAIFALPLGLFTAIASFASVNFASVNTGTLVGTAVTTVGLVASSLAYIYSRHMNVIDDIQMVRTKLFFSSVRRGRPYNQFGKPYAL